MAKFLLLFLFLFLSLATAADPTAVIYAGCSQSKYEPNSPYQSNVDSLLSSVANAASSSPYGKFTSDAASSSSPAYGVFQCRGDLDTATCRSCVRSALSHLSPLCPSSSGAALQLDGCFVRYDNESFIGKEETNLLYKNCGPNPRNGYDANLVGMRDDALSAIVSSGSTGGTYRVGASGFVQAAAQCVGDLSAKDCSDCISNAVSQLKSLCGDAVSGEVYLGKCFAKYYSGGGSSSSADGGGGGGGGRHYGVMAIVKRNARKRTLAFWGRNGHQTRLRVPYRKPNKLDYMTHKFKRNETLDEHISNMRNILFNMEVQKDMSSLVPLTDDENLAFRDNLDLNQESTGQEYFTDEAESSKKKVDLDNVLLSVTCDNEVEICSSDNITPCKRNLLESDVEHSVSVDLISPQTSSNKKQQQIKIEKEN